MNRHPTIRWKRLKASWRDTWLLTRQFGWPLLAFLIIVVGGGILYNILASYAGEPDANIFGSFYQVLALTFLQGLPHNLVSGNLLLRDADARDHHPGPGDRRFRNYAFQPPRSRQRMGGSRGFTGK